jgi:hypothetical protein
LKRRRYRAWGYLGCPLWSGERADGNTLRMQATMVLLSIDWLAWR